MADIDVLFAARPSRNVEIGSVTVDATIREVHGVSADMTEFPIETGSEVSDFVILHQPELAIEGEVSNSPISVFGFSGGIGVTERRVEAFEAFQAMRTQKQFIRIVTGLKVYTNMILLDFETEKTPKTGGRLQFRARFKELETASTQTSDLDRSKIKSSHQDQASKTTDGGTKSTTEATSQQADKGESAASALFGHVGQ
jgi:hypothetical protein